MLPLGGSGKGKGGGPIGQNGVSGMGVGGLGVLRLRCAPLRMTLVKVWTNEKSKYGDSGFTRVSLPPEAYRQLACDSV
jgi:hypothetical protein